MDETACEVLERLEGVVDDLAASRARRARGSGARRGDGAAATGDGPPGGAVRTLGASAGHRARRWARWTAQRRPRPGSGTAPGCARATPRPPSSAARCPICSARSARPGGRARSRPAPMRTIVAARVPGRDEQYVAVRGRVPRSRPRRRRPEPAAGDRALPQPRPGRRLRAAGARRAPPLTHVRAADGAVGRVRRRRGRDGHHRAARVHRPARTRRSPPGVGAQRGGVRADLRGRDRARRSGRAPAGAGQLRRRRGDRRPTGGSDAATVPSPDRSTPTTSARCSATARWRGSSPDRARSRSTSAGRGARSHHRCGGRSSSATTGVDIPAAPDPPAGATRTT